LSQLRVAVVRRENLAAEAGEAEGGRGTLTIENRYQATASVDLEDFMCAVVTLIFVVSITQ
jgi:hypothetical protein